MRTISGVANTCMCNALDQNNGKYPAFGLIGNGRHHFKILLNMNYGIIISCMVVRAAPFDWTSHCRCQMEVYWRALRSSTKSPSAAVRWPLVRWPLGERSPHWSPFILIALVAPGRRSFSSATKHQDTARCRYGESFKRTINEVTLTKLPRQSLILICGLLCRWVSGKQWFMGRQRTSWSWQNRPVSTWTPTRRRALPQGPWCFKAAPSRHMQHNSTRPTTQTSTEWDNPVKTHYFISLRSSYALPRRSDKMHGCRYCFQPIYTSLPK